MRYGRALAGLATTVTVAGCAALVLGMSSRLPHGAPSPSDSVVALDSTTPPPQLALPSDNEPVMASTSAASSTAPRPTVTASPHPPASVPATPVRVTTQPAPPAGSTHAPVRTAPRSTSPRTSTPPPPVRGASLPLGYSTGTATRVITVTASHSYSTTATLQAWTKAPGGGWLRYGGAVTAHVGSQGLTSAPSESKSATPVGSFTLTQAFGHYGNPGTPLPYFQTNSADWWISQSGSLYNTHQHCSGSCPFTQGNPNEHLYYETPYYNYAVVIDYNTRNAPGGVRQGAGSAFFLHVTDGHSTAGCVAIPQSTLVDLMRWLSPSAHPRILIGVN